MARWLPTLRRNQVEERDASYPVTLSQLVEMFKFNGTTYPVSVFPQTTLRNQREEIGSDFGGLAANAYRSNAIVFACMNMRMSAFSEARLIFREMRNGRPGNLFGTQDLKVLERPWPNGTTGDLLARMIQDVDLAGNFYGVRSSDGIVRLRPDWVSILLSSRTRRADWVPGDPDTEIAAYLFHPGGRSEGETPITFFPDQVAHFAPIPDPMAFYRGMSWLTPLVREIQADQMMTAHKSKFLEQGATVNLVVKVPATTVQSFNDWVQALKEGHDGWANAYKTMYLGNGADATPIGSDLQQMDFRSVQGAGETRIASAAGTPPVLVGLSEGLQGSSLNAGNYQAARRRFADQTIRPLWRNAAASLETLVTVPNASSGNHLWYDDRDIAFLQEDMKDTAEVQAAQAAAVNTLINSGFEPDASIDAITADDFSRLVGKHTGLTSVQLQPPSSGTVQMNGKGTVVAA